MTENKPVHLTPPEEFSYNDENATTAGTRWPIWVRDLDTYLEASGIDHPAQMKAIMLHCGGKAVKNVYYTLTDHATQNYKQIMELLLAFFKPMKNLDYEKFQFGQIKQRSCEIMDDYVVKLRAQAERCEFGDAAAVNAEIKKQIIATCSSHKLREHILVTTDISLEDILKKARLQDYSSRQSKAIEITKSETAIKQEPMSALNDRSRNYDSSRRENQGTSSRADHKSSTSNKPRLCRFCNYVYPHKGEKPYECPAKEAICRSCKVKGHFEKASICTKNESKTSNKSHFKKTRQNAINESPVKSSDSNDSDDAWTKSLKQFTINEIEPNQSVFTLKDNPVRPKIELELTGGKVVLLIDSGSGRTVIDEITSKLLDPKPILTPPSKNDRQLYSYDGKSPLETIGSFYSVMTCKETQRTIEILITVVKGNPGNLLCFKDARRLNLFGLSMFSQLDDEYLNLNVCSDRTFYDKLIKDIPEVYNENVGKLMIDGKPYQVVFDINKSIVPVVQKYRRVAYHLIPAAEKELTTLMNMGVLERSSGRETWVSQIVVVPKEKKPGEVRITSDARCLNKAIVRQRLVMPTLEEVAYDLEGSVCFSEIDFNKAFHQLELAEESRDITTIETTLGMLRYKVLFMGVHNATELFTWVIKYKVLQGLKGVKNIADNIIVFGKTVAEHDENLLALSLRLKERGLTASPNNCRFGVSKIKFFGVNYSKDGVAVHEDKVKSLLNTPDPVDAKELRGFLGLAVYCSSHIPQLATLASTLWNLTAENVKFEWKAEHSEAMNKIKKALITDSLAFFNRKWLTELTVDASPVGLGGVLAQIDPFNKKVRNIVMFISRKLTEIEGRMSQIEKEGLGVVWACERLYLYLIGTKFTIITDNRAIELIYNNPKSNPPLRIRRWALRLMAFDYVIIHRPGEFNIADFLSRHPIDEPDNDNTECYINFICDYAIPLAMSRATIVRETNLDPALVVLRNLIAGNSVKDTTEAELIIGFKSVIPELTITHDGIVLRDDKLVLPVGLYGQALAIAHLGHQGMTRTKALMRTKLWFPNMDKLVEDLTKGCFPCQLVDSGPTQQPIKSSPYPEEPGTYLDMDYFGPLPNGNELMVAICEYSHYPWVVEVKSTAAEYAMPKLDELFSEFGVPIEIKTDNGPPYNGHLWAEFANYFGFHHRKVAAEHAPANGCVEAFMKPLRKCIQTAITERKDWHQTLVEFLRSYRSTPHPTTGLPPSTLMFGSNRTNLLPTIIKESKSREEYKK